MQDAICVPTGGFFKSNLAERSSPVWFLGVHFFDLIRFITGRQPWQVRATAYKQAVVRRGVNTYDAVKADFVLDNGAAVSFFLCWNLPDAIPGLTAQGLYLQFSDGELSVNSSDRGFKATNKNQHVNVNPMFLRQTDHGKAGYGLESIG